MRITNNEQNFKAGNKLSNSLNAFYNPNATIPTLLIESGVTLGRSFEAYKRGGKKEASERLVEQGVSAVIWIYGVQFLQKIGEYFGKKIFKNTSAFEHSKDEKDLDLAKKIKNFDFDIGFDKTKNIIKKNDINRKIANFKIGNLILATTIATVFIGFILPKINHKISSIVEKNDKKNQNTNLKTINLEEYKKQTKKQVNFKGNIFNNLAHNLENNSTARLFITDLGVVSGRYKNGRNKYEKIEGLFRDITSMFFYLKSTDLIVKGLNKLTNTININPEVINQELDVLKTKIANGETKENIITYLSKIKEDKKFMQQAIIKATKKGKRDYRLTYVSDKQIKNVEDSISKFSNLIIDKLKNINSSELKDEIEKIAKNNIRKNFAFYAIGTLISTYILGIIIPKVQYLITKKITNSNKFPGADDYKVK